MKRICFVVTDAISFNVLYRGHLEQLVSQGFHLTLLCGGSPEEIKTLEHRCVGEVVQVGLVRPPRLLADLAAFFQLLAHFLRFRYEVVVVSTPKAIFLGTISAMLGRQPRRIVFFRGRVYENFGGGARKLYEAFDRIAAWCAHEILFVSHSLKTEYQVLGGSFSGKGKVLGAGSGNGVDATRFAPNSIPDEHALRLRKSLGIGPLDFVALTVGRVSTDKGLAELDAVAELAADSGLPVIFVLVGPVESGSEEALSSLMRRGNVTHVGYTDNVPPYFAIADVHLFLTHREGFGNVAVEAAAMGVPTIAFDVVGVRDSVANGVSGIRVPFGDVEAVWRGMERLYSDPEAAAREYAGARQWVLDNFSQDRVWALFGEYYAR